jgi:acyl-CoA thioesterase II
MDVLEQLVSLLALEKLEENLFRGQSQDLGWGRVFGGQVLGQALSAAVQTVPSERPVHSLHAYFLRPGDVRRPILYQVDRIRDGGSFTTRRIVAVQNGAAIFNMAASFQVAEEGFEHHDAMPPAPDPLTVPGDAERYRAHLDQLPPSMRDELLAIWPIELKPVEDEGHPIHPSKEPPRRMVWLKARGKLPDTPSLHAYLLAYASDFSFMTTSLKPHGATWLTPKLQLASLDHVMWFHRPLRIDDWLLHVMESPSASGARGLVRGQVFDRAGRLVASTAQEGLIRRLP